MSHYHAHPVFPHGFRCVARNCGLKPSGPDLAMFVSSGDASAAALFTRNHFPGAPVVLGRETLMDGCLRAVVVNSKISNVATGATGLEHARRMAAAAAAELNTRPQRVLVASTGLIGVPLPIEKIEQGIAGAAAELQADPLVGATAMMTTDTHPKALSLAVGEATITVVAKGSGMIEPNLATMLAFIFTDARFSPEDLDGFLRDVVNSSFNMLSVDTDTSTSDTCAILANGLAGPVDRLAFHDALRAGCIRMTEMLAQDGEGATKLLRVKVLRAAGDAEARRIAKTVVNSPLVKTMAYGADPNVGRILMAVGKCVECRVVPGQVVASINGVPVIEGGERSSFDEAELRQQLSGDCVDIEVDLAVGGGEATAYGCDLSEGYIRENAAYASS